jgi:hypothetical protein
LNGLARRTGVGGESALTPAFEHICQLTVGNFNLRIFFIIDKIFKNSRLRQMLESKVYKVKPDDPPFPRPHTTENQAIHPLTTADRLSQGVHRIFLHFTTIIASRAETETDLRPRLKRCTEEMKHGCIARLSKGSSLCGTCCRIQPLQDFRAASSAPA